MANCKGLLSVLLIVALLVPVWVESAAESQGRVAKSAKTGEAVDLNLATLEQLMQVPGMTVTWAKRIVRFRPYRTKLDLLDKGVVTKEVYERIREGVVAHRTDTAKTDMAK